MLFFWKDFVLLIVLQGINLKHNIKNNDLHVNKLDSCQGSFKLMKIYMVVRTVVLCVLSFWYVLILPNMSTFCMQEIGHFLAAFPKNVKLGIPFFIPNFTLGTFGAITQVSIS